VTEVESCQRVLSVSIYFQVDCFGFGAYIRDPSFKLAVGWGGGGFFFFFFEARAGFGFLGWMAMLRLCDYAHIARGWREGKMSNATVQAGGVGWWVVGGCGIPDRRKGSTGEERRRTEREYEERRERRKKRACLSGSSVSDRRSESCRSLVQSSPVQSSPVLAVLVPVVNS